MFDCWFNSEYGTPGSPLLLRPCAAARATETRLHLCPSVHPDCPLLAVGLPLCFLAFSKAHSPQRKGHTHTPPWQNAWTGWHDPLCVSPVASSPAFPVLLITDATTHVDTEAGCGTGNGGSLEQYDLETSSQRISVGLTAAGIRKNGTLKSALSAALQKKSFFFFGSSIVSTGNRAYERES